MNLILAKLRAGSNKSLHYNPIRRTFPGLRPFHLARFSSTHIHLVLWVHKDCSLLCGYTVTSWLTLGIGLHTCNPHGIRNMNNTDVCRVDPRVFLYLEHKMLGNFGTWIKLSKRFHFTDWASRPKRRCHKTGLEMMERDGRQTGAIQDSQRCTGAAAWCQHRWLRNNVWSTFVSWDWAEWPHQAPTSQGFPHSRPWHWTLLWSVPPADHFESFVFNYACWPSVTRWLPGSMTPSSISVLATGVRQQIPSPGTVKWKIGARTWASTKYLQAKRYAPPCVIYPPPDARF